MIELTSGKLKSSKKSQISSGPFIVFEKGLNYLLFNFIKITLTLFYSKV